MARNKNRRNIKRREDDRRLVASYQAKYTAPIPPPAWLEQYERAHPGAADRIFAQWEGQTRHRQSLESQVVRSNIGNERLGMWFAFILALVVFGISWRLFELNRNVEAFAVLIGEVGLLSGLFIWGRRKQEQERKQKQRAEIEHPMLPFGEPPQ